MITKKEYTTLKKYTKAFNYALKSDCVPAFAKDELDEMETIYKKLGKSLDNRRCGHCILTMVQLLGKEYYDYENKPNQKRHKEEQTNNTTKSEGKVGSEETNNLK